MNLRIIEPVHGAPPAIPWLLITGAVTILAQVVLLRELVVAFYGVELIVLLSLGLLLLGTAGGAFAGRWFTSGLPGQIRWCFLALSLLVPALIVFIRGLRIVFSETPGAFLPFGQQIGGMALALLPFGLLSGFLFQRTALLHVTRGRSLPSAYAVESVGGLFGGCAATILIAAGVQNLASGLVSALLASAACALPDRTGAGKRWTAAALPVFLLILLGIASSHHLDETLTSWNHHGAVDTIDTPYGRLTVADAEGQVSVFDNGALSWESHGTSAEEFAHMAALQVKEPQRVLLLGGGPEGLLAEALKHGPREIVHVELDAAALRKVMPHLPPESRDAFRNHRVTQVIADTRNVLNSSRGFDLILSGAPEPSSGQSNRHYTREAFAACRRAMNPDGVLALRLRSAENLWTPVLLQRTAGIHRALRDVFEDVLVLPGTVNIILASDAPLVRDPDVLSSRMARRGIEARLVSQAYIRYLLTNDRRTDFERRLVETDVPSNADSRPVCYFLTLVHWLSRFYPDLAQGTFSPPDLSAPSGLAGIGGLWVAVLVPVLVLRRFRGIRLALLVFAAGCAGMILEGMLILAYQSRSGVLYQDLGILLTLFMAGLGAGAVCLDRASRKGREHRALRRWGSMFATGTVALSLATAWHVYGEGRGGLPVTGVLLFASGMLTGGLFAYAGLKDVERQARAISPLVAADLLGGCVGSLTASLLLLPILGLAPTALLLAAASLALFLLL